MKNLTRTETASPARGCRYGTPSDRVSRFILSVGTAPACMLLLVFPAILGGCMGLPDGVNPVTPFDLNRYLGTWYEIARLDHRFERGLEKVTAEYSLLADGDVRVVNRGFSASEESWKVAEGRARPARGQDEGYLKVSFFGPLYSSYVVFELDQQNYRYAFVSGYNSSYLWLLARKPSVSPEVIERFVGRARELGFDVDDLIFVKHDGAMP